MSAPVPIVEPVTLAAGDTLTFGKTFTNFPVSEGWTLSYRLIGRASGSTPIEIPASEDLNSAGSFLVNVQTETTASWTAGKYRLIGFVSLGSDRFKIYEGDFTITPNLAAVDSYDPRSKAEQMLELVEDMLVGRVARAEVSYSINGRSMTFHTTDDLMSLRDRLKSEVAMEKGRFRKILTRFRSAR